METFDPDAYGTVIADLLRESRVMTLNTGIPNDSTKPALGAYTDGAAFSPHAIADTDMAACCRSALWLYHDYLDTSHTISQGITTETGSYWHAIMHRREPDYPNSKYWFGRAGDHSVFPAIREAAAGIAATATSLPDSATFLTTQSAWDPYAFVDLCKAANFGRTPVEDLCRQIQQREWEILFDYCYQTAVG